MLDSSQTEGLKDENSTALLKQLEALGEVFMKAAADDIPTEVSIQAFIMLVNSPFCKQVCCINL
uniref:Heat shock protein 70 (HSP70)-interacting protein n=1 Tax=Solanum tuberosum TaxID=4113 RepID=M1BSL1_SOLTU